MTAYTAAFDWARRQVGTGRLPTAVLGIATAERIVALDAFGATDGRPASIDHHYALFSITKPIVGLAALRAIERGLLSPTTPLAAAVPEFGADRADEVRLDHLVSHTSGIVEPPLDTPAGLRPSLLAKGRDFAAGTASRYSSIAFEGVAALVEQATDAPWEHSVNDVASAAGADGLTFDPAVDAPPIVDARAQGLDVDRFASLRHPGAGLFGRAADLLALGSALLRDDGSVVHPSTRTAMLRPLHAAVPRLEPYPAERGQDWGFAWNLRSRAPGLLERDVFGHGGRSGTEFWIYPGLGVCFTLLTNRADRPGVDADELHNAIAAATD
jgi:CubicO group peptidase (beta-lactamase class C family)